jgi:hypothetical protein
MVLQPRLFIPLAARERKRMIHRRIGLCRDFAEGIVLQVILHGAGGIHEIADRPEIVVNGQTSTADCSSPESGQPPVHADIDA